MQEMAEGLLADRAVERIRHRSWHADRTYLEVIGDRPTRPAWRQLFA
jgi:hypothetical protein